MKKAFFLNNNFNFINCYKIVLCKIEEQKINEDQLFFEQNYLCIEIIINENIM